MSRFLKIAAVQIAPKIGDLTTNLEKFIKIIGDAARQGADVVIFPELALTGYNQDVLGDKLVKLALTVEDKPIQQLTQAARTNKICLVVGFIEKRTIPGDIYNSVVIIDNDGSILGTYAKTHLFSSEYLHFREGPTINIFQSQHGIFGPLICMDLGFPEVARLLCLQGAELLIACSAWISLDEDLWSLSLQARASDNMVFIVGVNLTGVEGDLEFIGQSMVVGPRGNIIDRLDTKEGILFTTIDLDEVVNARRRAPRFTQRRPELYAPISEAY